MCVCTKGTHRTHQRENLRRLEENTGSIRMHYRWLSSRGTGTEEDKTNGLKYDLIHLGKQDSVDSCGPIVSSRIWFERFHLASFTDKHLGTAGNRGGLQDYLVWVMNTFLTVPFVVQFCYLYVQCVHIPLWTMYFNNPNPHLHQVTHTPLSGQWDSFFSPNNNQTYSFYWNIFKMYSIQKKWKVRSGLNRFLCIHSRVKPCPQWAFKENSLFTILWRITIVCTYN